MDGIVVWAKSVLVYPWVLHISTIATFLLVGLAVCKTPRRTLKMSLVILGVVFLGCVYLAQHLLVIGV